MALTRKSIPSPNYSSRGGAQTRIIVVHTAEGARTIEELGNFFASTSSGVSSHTGADDKSNTIGEYVKRPNKAWAAMNANPVAVQIELCAFAKWSLAEWNKHPNMLENCAKWIAEEAAYFNIPITKLSPSQAQGSGRGVCQHADLGSWGGGHWDCGSGFPMDRVLDMARGGGGDDMGYPQWYWDWANWYLTTDRDPKARPDSAPDTIPEWAWDANDELTRINKRYGMTGGERDWIDWLIAGKTGKRPDVPDDIPDRWWDDQKYVAAKEK
jgi:N-acetylmuramoyl-L-alanine amidase